MKNNWLMEVKNTIPQKVRTLATVFLGVAIIASLFYGFFSGVNDARSTAPSAQHGSPSVIVILCFGLAAALFLVLWALLIGYVYGDARRRGMPPVPWTLIAFFVPNLLGILFYFAMRKPLMSACGNCSHPVAAGQRFCSACGQEQSSSGSSVPPADSTPNKSSGPSLRGFATGFLMFFLAYYLMRSFMSYWNHDARFGLIFFAAAMLCLGVNAFIAPKSLSNRFAR